MGASQSSKSSLKHRNSSHSLPPQLVSYATQTLGNCALTSDDDIRAMFQAIDLNNNQIISRVEIVKCLNSIGLRPGQDAIDRLFKEIDENGNGEIDFSEFKDFVQLREVQLVKIFRDMDQDLDGRVNENEIMFALKHYNLKADRETVRKFIERFDADESGTINYSEFRKLTLLFPSIEVAHLLDRALLSHSVGYYSIPKHEGGEHQKKKHPFVILASGGTAGLVSRTLTAPADRLKVM